MRCGAFGHGAYLPYYGAAVVTPVTAGPEGRPRSGALPPGLVRASLNRLPVLRPGGVGVSHSTRVAEE